MRYVKVLLLAILFFLALVFFFQNQNALSQNLVLTLNLFFLPPMASIPLPFYFLIVAAFFVGAVLALAFLVWDKVNLSARLMKSKWRVSSLEREMENCASNWARKPRAARFCARRKVLRPMPTSPQGKTSPQPRPVLCPKTFRLLIPIKHN